MATIIQELKSNTGDTILPRTKGKAVTMEDGTTLEYAIKNRPASDVKLTGSTATALGVPDGTSLADYLESISASSIIATAQLV